jgi:hypothetical protein
VFRFNSFVEVFLLNRDGQLEVLVTICFVLTVFLEYFSRNTPKTLLKQNTSSLILQADHLCLVAISQEHCLNETNSDDVFRLNSVLEVLLLSRDSQLEVLVTMCFV